MKKGKATQSIHGKFDKSFHSVTYPIYQTSNFAVNNIEDYAKASTEEEFYFYTRYSNPTLRSVEEKLARLENAEDGVLFTSGMAAITTTFFSFIKNGDTIVASPKLYGMTYHFLKNVAPTFNIKVKFCYNNEELYKIDEICPDAKLVYFETPTNPTTECISIAKIVEASKKIGAIVVIDNTFASPINQNPIDFGVDIIVHSITKYLGGHSDLIAGATVGSKKLMKVVRENMKIFGGCISPIEAFLIDRSLKTLKVRVEKHNQNALTLAEFFSSDKKIKKVFYPGLRTSFSYEIAKNQMKGFGGMLCIELDSLESAKKLCNSLQLVVKAPSLGGVESLICIPALTSHAKMCDDELESIGVTKGMVRISAGLEDIEDLLDDFKNALTLI